MRSHAATSQIREAISHGRYTPGQKLNEQQLADQLGISRNTLRECFAELASQGIITRIPHRGVFISVPSRDEVQDFYTARALLEPNALRSAQSNIATLDSIVTIAEQSLADDDFLRVADANQRFHKAIVSSAGSQIIDETMGRILALMRLAFMQILVEEPEFHRPYVGTNRSIVEDLRNGDHSTAANTLEQSLLTTRDKIAPYLASEVVYGV